MNRKMEKPIFIRDLDSSRQGSTLVVGIDKKGNIIRFNETLEQLTGSAKKDVINSPFESYFSRQIPKEELEKLVREARYNPGSIDLDTSFQTVKGENVVVSWTGFPIKNEQNGRISQLNLVGTPQHQHMSTKQSKQPKKTKKESSSQNEHSKNKDKKTSLSKKNNEVNQQTSTVQTNENTKKNTSSNKKHKLSKSFSKNNSSNPSKEQKKKTGKKSKKKTSKKSQSKKRKKQKESSKKQKSKKTSKKKKIRIKRRSKKDKKKKSTKKNEKSQQSNDESSIKVSIKNYLPNILSSSKKSQKKEKDKQPNISKSSLFSKKTSSSPFHSDKKAHVVNNSKKNSKKIIKDLKKENKKLKKQNKSLENKLHNAEIKKDKLKDFLNSKFRFIRDSVGIKKKREEFQQMMKKLNEREQKLEKIETEMIVEKKEFKQKIQEFITWREKLEKLESEIEKRREFLSEQENFLNKQYDKVLSHELTQPATYNEQIEPQEESEDTCILEKDDLFNSLTVEAAVLQRGRIKKANKLFADMLGYSEDELVGKHLVDFVGPNGLSGVEQHYMNRLKGVDDSKYQTVFLSKAEDEIPVKVHVKTGDFQGERAEIATFNEV